MKDLNNQEIIKKKYIRTQVKIGNIYNPGILFEKSLVNE